MSDTQAVESTRKRGRAQKQTERVEPERIKYGRTVIAKGKRLAATLKSGDAAEKELGELADRLQPKYGDKTLACFAKAIGLSADRLNRCRSVYRAYKDKPIKGTSPNFGLYQALQAHPKRDEIINIPGMTVAKARTFMRDYRKAQGQGQEEDARVRNTRGWLNEVVEFAAEAYKKYGYPMQERLDPVILRQATDDPDKVVRTVRLGARTLSTLADEFERAFAPPTPPPMFDDKPNADEAASSDAPSDEATPTDATPDQAT
jgi:hypothetical protein